MPNPSVTNTMVTGAVITAGSHNQNYTDIVNALTDGTKDLTINALTTAGNMTCSGALSVSGTMTVNGDIAGSRETISLGGQSSFVSNSVWPSPGVYADATAETSFGAPRAGSIVGYSVYLNPTTFTTTMVFAPCIMKNAATQTVATNLNVSTSAPTYVYGTFARNTYAFVAGDRIGIKFVVVTTGNVTVNSTSALEIQYTT